MTRKGHTEEQVYCVPCKRAALMPKFLTAISEEFATTELNMRPFESPDDALPAPLPEGGATEISGSCTPQDHAFEGLDSEAKKSCASRTPERVTRRAGSNGSGQKLRTHGLRFF